MISRPVVVSPVNATLATRGWTASGLPASTPKPLTMLTTPGGSRSATRLIQIVDRGGGLLGRLEHDGVAGGQRGGQLPGRHQDREVPRDDLGDDAERLVEVVGDGVLVDLRERALLGPDRAREVAEVVDGERDVGGQRLADRLAVLPALGDGELLEVLLHPVGDLVEDVARSATERAAPGARRRRARRRGPVSTSSAVPRAISVKVLPVTGVGFSKYWPCGGATYSPPIQWS